MIMLSGIIYSASNDASAATIAKPLSAGSTAKPASTFSTVKLKGQLNVPGAAFDRSAIAKDIPPTVAAKLLAILSDPVATERPAEDAARLRVTAITA
jgi:hypothetical protein